MEIKPYLPGLILSIALAVQPTLADCCGPLPTTPQYFSPTSGWSTSIFYDRTQWGTLLHSRQEISGDQLLVSKLRSGLPRFSIPTRMMMERSSLELRYAFNERNALRIQIPWLNHEMDMQMITSSANGGTHQSHHHQQSPIANHQHKDDHHATIDDHLQPDEHHHGHEPQPSTTSPQAMMMSMPMKPITGLSDINVSYRFTFPMDHHTAWIGAGMILPTGAWDTRGDNGQLIHNMMQPGSGAFGLIAEGGANLRLGQSNLTIQPTVSVTWHATNPLGYQRGARLDYGVSTQYQIHPRIHLGLGVLGAAITKDRTNNTIDPHTGLVAFQNPNESIVDDINNTGGTSFYLASQLHANPTENITLGLEYRLPFYQKLYGSQLGIDRQYRAFLNVKF